ncbi:MAG TPA: hypothetical protein VHU40_18005 [Polyangia bacterium]|jgi:hypothetical protein|nr:hypothetical protein [Polyangia bacterium]
MVASPGSEGSSGGSESTGGGWLGVGRPARGGTGARAPAFASVLELDGVGTLADRRSDGGNGREPEDDAGGGAPAGRIDDSVAAGADGERGRWTPLGSVGGATERLADGAATWALTPAFPP